MDILIVGGGPSGSCLGRQLAKKFDVTIIDKKKEVGKLACSGLISSRIRKFVPLKKDFLEHKIKGAVFHSPDYSFSVKRNEVQAYVVDRLKFDKYLLERAESSGANVESGTSFESFRIKDGFVEVKTNKGFLKPKIIVGADGAASSVRRFAGLKGRLKSVNGVVSYSDEKDCSELVDLFYGKNIAPGFFAWKIPRGERTEYGLASDKNHLAYFRKFLKKMKANTEKVHAHPIVFGNQESVSERLLLLGDAAAQVKPFSGGGIIYGLLSAEIAANTITKAFRENNFSKEFFYKEYESCWKNKLMEKIEIGMGIRNILDSLSNDELDTLFKVLDENKLNISNLGDMDFL